MKNLDLIPGIYLGYISTEKFSNENLNEFDGRVFESVVSLGFNPQYGQRDLNLEVLILENFGDQEFYGSEMNLKIFGFLRPEAKFAGFSDFIFGMNNDVQAVKDFNLKK